MNILNTPSSQSRFDEEICLVELYEGSNEVLIENRSILNLGVNGFEIGREFNEYELRRVGTDGTPRESFDVAYQVSCRNSFNQRYTVSGNLLFSNRDELIIEMFGSGGMRNSQNHPYLDTNSYTIPLNVSALEGVTCNNVVLRSINNPSLEIDRIIDSNIMFTNLGLRQTHPLNAFIELNFSEVLSPFSNVDGQYGLTLECNLLGNRDFERELFFEINTQVPNLDLVRLIHLDENKWEILNNEVYIDALGEDLLIGEIEVNKENLNNYIRTSLKLNIEDEDLVDEITSLKICGREVSLSSLRITQNLFTLDESLGCRASYNEEFSSIELLTRIEVETSWGTSNSQEIITNLEFLEPSINVRTRDGGMIIDETLYFSEENPEILVDLALPPFREFSCSVQPVVGGNPLDGMNYSSSNSRISFTLSNILTQGILSTIDSLDVSLMFNCEENLFNKNTNREIQLVKDNIDLRIENVEFTNIGTNWVYPTVGTSQVFSDIQIQLSNMNNYVSCEVLPRFGSNPLVQSTNRKQAVDRDTNLLVIEDVLTLVRRNTQSNSFLVLTNSNSLESVPFEVGVRCSNAAGRTVQRNFSGFSLSLFDYGSIGVRGELNRDKRLNLEVDTLANLDSSTLNIRDENSGVLLYSGLVSSLSPQKTQIGSINRYNFRGINIQAQTLLERSDYPLNIEFIIGEVPVSNILEIMVDNTNPEVYINLNTNDDGVVYENFISGDIVIRDFPTFSSGIYSYNIQFRRGSELLREIPKTHYSEMSYSLNLNEIEEFRNLTVGSYSITVTARDYFGNSNTTTRDFRVSDQIFITLLESSNVGLYELNPTTWYTYESYPTLRFESTQNLNNCNLMPGSSGGYIGGIIPFESEDGQTFELNLNSHQSSFEILPGRRNLILSCQRADRNETLNIGVNLYKIDSFPDYILSFDWGLNQILMSTQTSRVVDFNVLQRSEFRDVTCEVRVRGSSLDQNVNLNPSGGVGNFNGSISLGVGNYMFTLLCQTPTGQVGPIKTYDVVMTQEPFRIDLISVEHQRLGFNSRIEDSNVIRLPREILSESNKNIKITFTNNYQNEMTCTIDTTKSGIVNFILSLFRNTRVATMPILQGMYEGIVEIEESVNSVQIRCLPESGLFSTRTFNFPVEFIDISSVEIGDVRVEGER
ncbi:MAG: hypothetical protein LAT82_02460 [Nanoarchaeota archaeon]|nr:hypothetical protein [Nanoarchaeota archaeon]